MDCNNNNPQTVSLTACPEPFHVRNIKEQVPYGWTVAEMVLHAIPHVVIRQAHVFVNGDYIPQDMWLRVRPKPGTVVTIRIVPGKGGGGGKNPIATVLSLALIVAAPALGAQLATATGLATQTSAGLISWTVGGFSGLSIATGIVSVVGRLAINALAPPSKQKSGAGPSGSLNVEEKPTQFITGGRNRILRFGAIPRPLGRHRILPPYGALPFTETVGNDQYVRMLFVWGYGPLEISDLRIGDTSLNDFTDVEIETRQGYEDDDPLTLFTEQINQNDLSITLTQAAGYQLRTTEDDTDEISLDVTFPRGLANYGNSGVKSNQTVEIEVQYALTGSGTWSYPDGVHPAFVVTAKQSAAIRQSLRFKVPRGQYDVRLRRLTPDNASDTIVDEVTWTALRSIRNESPVRMTGLAMTVLRIKATDQLNGVVDQLSGIVHSILPDWNGTDWVEAATSNPASMYREVLQGKANARALENNRLDLPALQEWHENCETAGREFNYVVDTQLSVHDLLADIAAAGRASPAVIDGKWRIVQDKPQSIPAQVFTPRNSFGFQAEKTFPDLPHGFRVKFINRDKDWQADERIVYDDGYDDANATKFEGLSLTGVTDPGQAWKDGRYHIATARLRPEKFTFNTDIEYIVCTRGDHIRFTHDVLLVGLGSARIKSIEDDGTNVTAITVDDTFAMEAGKDYSARIRKADGTNLVKAVTTAAGETKYLEFSTPFALANTPGIGDLVLFGETGEESIECVVRSIEPQSDLTARITCVDAAPAVHMADTGTIPAYDSHITVPPEMVRSPAPVVANVQAGNEALVINTGGNYIPSIIVTLDAPQYYLPLTPVILIKEESETVYGPAEVSANNNHITITGVQTGETYDLQIYYLNKAGLYSATTSVSDITVTGGQGHPPAPVNFSAQQNGGTVVFKWSKVVWYALRGQDILYGPRGGTIEGALFLTEAAAGTEMTNAGVPPGDWTFYNQTRDYAGQVSETAASVDLAVVNDNTEIFSDGYEPAWNGNAAESYGFYTHWTGKLIPLDQHPPSYYGWEIFDEFVPTPVAECVFTGKDYDAGFLSKIRIWNNIHAVNGPSESGNPDIKFRLATSNAPFGGIYNFMDFAIGMVDARYFSGQLVYTPEAGSVSFIDLFRMVGDAQLQTKAVNGFAVGSGGTVVIFADHGLVFHEPPNIQVTVASGTGTSATAVNVTELSAEIHNYNGTTGVSGTSSITITGV